MRQGERKKGVFYSVNVIGGKRNEWMETEGLFENVMPLIIEEKTDFRDIVRKMDYKRIILGA